MHVLRTFRHARPTRAVADRASGRRARNATLEDLVIGLEPVERASERASDGRTPSRRPVLSLSLSLSLSFSLTFPARIPGSIPAFYREVYEKVCSPTSGNVKLEVFRSLLVKSQLSGSIVNQVRPFYISFLNNLFIYIISFHQGLFFYMR